MVICEEIGLSLENAGSEIKKTGGIGSGNRVWWCGRGGIGKAEESCERAVSDFDGFDFGFFY